MIKTVAVVLILAGALALAYGGFTYTKGSKNANIGPIKLSLQSTQRVNVPVWAGVAALVAGGGLLLVGSKKR